MKWSVGVLVFIVLVVAVLATWSGRAWAQVDERFEVREQKGEDGKVLPYRLVRPAGYKAQADDHHPLVIFLHGAGERGNNNRSQLVHGSQMMLDMATTYGAFVLVPQCPGGEKWVDVNWSLPAHKMPSQASASMALVMQTLDKLQAEFRIDARRIYVMGLSMGGYGSWDALQRYPKVFAAGVPICGGGDDSAAAAIEAPVWCFHGDKDGAVPVARSRNMVAALKKAGREVKYTEYPGCGHNAWGRAFADPELLPWLFAQKRGE